MTTAAAPNLAVAQRVGMLRALVVSKALDVKQLDEWRWLVSPRGKKMRFIYQPVSDCWRSTSGMHRGRGVFALLDLSKTLP